MGREYFHDAVLLLGCLIACVPLSLAQPSTALVAQAPVGMAASIVASAPGPAGNMPVSVLFVMQATNVTLTPVTGEAGNWTLLASGVQPGVVAFTDTPVRFASVINARFFTTDPRFLVNGVWLDNPNVAMSAANSTTATSPEITVMTFFSPTFAPATRSLSSKVRIVEKPEDLSHKPKPELQFYFENTEAIKRAAKKAAVPAQRVAYRPVFFIDNLVGFGNDFVGDFLDNGLGGGDYF